jgi:hypothetical protein
MTLSYLRRLAAKELNIDGTLQIRFVRRLGVNPSLRLCGNVNLGVLIQEQNFCLLNIPPPPHARYIFLVIVFPKNNLTLTSTSDNMPRSSDDNTLQFEPEHNDQRQQNEADGGESGKKEEQNGGGPIGFWNKELRAVRLDVFKNWGITSR